VSILTLTFKQTLASACILVSGLAYGATESMPAPSSEDGAVATTQASPGLPLFEPMEKGGALPFGVQVEDFQMENSGDDHVSVTGIARTAEAIGILAVQLEQHGWLSHVEITKLTRRNPDRSFPWIFRIQGMISMEGRSRLSAR